MNLIELLQLENSFQDLLHCIEEEWTHPKSYPILINGLAGSAQELYSASLIKELSKKKKPLLVLAQDSQSAISYTALLNSFGIQAAYFPDRDYVYYEYSASHDIERERLFVLYSLINKNLDVVVTTPIVAASFTIPQNKLLSSTISLFVGDTCDMDQLINNLISLGFIRCEMVEQPGQFSRRGGIIDLWGDQSNHPIRLEFFGDEIDRMCYFDESSQRLLERCDSFLLLPAYEVLINSQNRPLVEKHLHSLQSDEEGILEINRELDALTNGSTLYSRDRFISLLYPEKETLLSYLGEKSVIFFLGTNEITTSLKTAMASRTADREPLKEHGLLTNTLSFELNEKSFFDCISTHLCVHLNSFAGSSFQKEGGLFGIRSRLLPCYMEDREGSTMVFKKAFQDDLKFFIEEQYYVVINVSSKSELVEYENLLKDFNIPIGKPKDTSFERGVVYFSISCLQTGFDLPNSKIAVLNLSTSTQNQVKRTVNAQIKKKKYSPGQAILSYSELHEGDYVVHEKYGIGRYLGITPLVQDGFTKDYITIQYAGTDKLFIPADKIEEITKYIGPKEEGDTVKLSIMGGASWEKTKSKAKGAVREMAHELIQLYAQRQRKPGISFFPDEAMEEEFYQDFDYDLTEAQSIAVQDILKDMEKKVPMDRLLCGDVGFGKTEVALRAAFRAVINNYQVAILAPTTILAMQHYQTLISRMRHFPVHIDMISRLRTNKEKEKIYAKIKRGETDIVVGTHSLLANSVEFKKLGLLIIDEEQRFGVAQKEKMKQLSTNIDVLTLTATPIPRTLNMAISGIRDLSVLDEAPGERKPVQTYVLEYREDIIDSAIRKELSRSGQVFYLYNNIENIDLVAQKLQDKFPGARVAYAHGQMEHEELETIWESLVRGEIDILVSTTIVETGIDLPNANTLIIENADRMGLSQLHQIRGRIGRSSRQAYAYFTFRPGKTLTEIAYKRLCAIREYAEFGAGFQIALRDLEIRGAGDLLGASQHGHIASVGYDLYMKLLEEAILEEQGKTKEPIFQTKISITVDAHIPESYISSAAYRMEMYKKIILIETKEDFEDIVDEFCDRFGDPPKATIRLLYIALIKAISSRLKLKQVCLECAELKVYPSVDQVPVWAELFYLYKNMRLPSTSSPCLSFRLDTKIDYCKQIATILTQYEDLTKNKEEKQNDQQ